MTKSLILRNFWDRIQQHRLLTGEIICFFIFIFVIVFQNTSIAENLQKIQELGINKTLIDNNERNAIGLNDDLNELEISFTKIRNRLLDCTNKSAFLRFSLESTKLFNVESDNPPQPLMSIISANFPFQNPNDKGNNTPIIKATYQIKIQGKFSDILSYLHFLEKQIFIGKITDLSITEGKTPELNSSAFTISFLGTARKI